MKKAFYTLLFIAFTTSVIAYSNSPKTTDSLPPANTDIKLLEGKWKMVKGEIYSEGKLIDTDNLKSDSCEYNYYEFLPKGIKKEVQYDDEDCSTKDFPGTWSYNASTKLLTIIDNEDGVEIKATVIEVTKNTLKIQLFPDEEMPENTALFMYLIK